MNFKRIGFSGSDKSATSADSKLVRTFRSIKNWFMPRTVEGRKMQILLCKDLGIFIVTTSLMCIFRDELKKVFEEDLSAAAEFNELGI